MNTEKIEKLKKSLSNSKIPADLKPKIEAEIKRLESLDNMVTEKAKEEKEEEKEEAKPVAKTRKPRAKKSTTRKPSETSKPKRTVMSLAKEIRKEGESWKDAQARASKMMKEGSKEVSKTVETELDKLSKIIRSEKNRKKLSGLSGTNIKRDSVRRAKPKGRRISKDGNVYYENRDNRTDRLAPNYPKNAPFLAEGGYLTDPTFGTFQNQVYAGGGQLENIAITYGKMLNDLSKEKQFNKKMEKNAIVNKYAKENDITIDNNNIIYIKGEKIAFIDKINQKTGQLKTNWDIKKFANGGAVRNERLHVNKDEDYEVRYSKPRPQRKGYLGKRDFMAGGRVESLTKELHRLQRELNSSRLQTYRLGDNSQEAKDRKKEREVKLARFNEVLKELRESDAKFELGGVMATDLAGHTGGGDAGLNAGMPLDGFSNTAYTGLVGETGAMSSGEMFMNGGGLPSGAEQSYMITESFGNPAQHYAKGGGVKTINGREYSYGRNWTNDHRHINKDEEHEVKYNRKGKFLGIFKEGGAIKNQYAGRTPEDIWNSLSVEQRKHFLLDHLWANEEEIEQIQYKRLEEGDKEFVDYYEVRTWKQLSGDVRKAFTSHVKEGEYNKGGALTNERLHVNHDEDYEVRYAKPRPSRKGYKDARKFMAGGSFANGGGVENKYNSMSKEDKEELMREKIGIGRTPFSEYEKYNQLSNYHKEEINKHFNSKKFMAGGMNNETPRIYVADLEAYNNGRLVGEWLDLSDYNDADELMDAIQDVLKKSGGEEYAIHDYENLPSSMYSEYMGKRDFEELYEMMELADKNDLPLEVVQEIVSQFDASAVDEFVGKYDSADDFAQQLTDDLGGIQNFNDFERYLTVSETDRRLLSQEMADSYVDDIRDEDGGNRLIEEAGMDVSEYEEADNETQQEMIDKATEIVYDNYYNDYFDGMSDPYNFLVEEQGIYDAESFANASFVQVDFEDLGDALEDDYTYIFYNSDLYVFNIR